MAAAASYLAARQRGGVWRLRLEDIDPERDRPEAAASILRQLTAHGLEWDGPVIYQSHHLERYRQQVQILIERGLAYGCDCPRKRLAALGYRYDGHCRARALPFNEAHALRLNAGRVEALAPADLSFHDQVYGRVSPTQPLDDFIVWRRGDLPAYQLAVVVDDADMGATHVVRGADLLHETHRQLALFRLFSAASPHYAHVPLVMSGDGRKLSKQNGAPALEPTDASANLTAALGHLGVQVPAELRAATPAELLAFGLRHFSLERLAPRAPYPL